MNVMSDKMVIESIWHDVIFNWKFLMYDDELRTVPNLVFFMIFDTSEPLMIMSKYCGPCGMT